MTVSVWIACIRHSFIQRGVIQKHMTGFVYPPLIGPNKLQRSSSHPFGSLGCIPHHKNWLPQSRSFLLDATRIRQDKVRPCKKIMEVENIKRIDKMQPIATIQFFVRSFSNQRIEMNRIYGLYIIILIDNPANRPEHAMHRLAKILPAMGRN